VLHDFCGSGGCPDGSVAHGITADANGNLFGVTEYGGNPQNGVLYRLVRKKSYAEQVLYSFCQLSSCADGASPVAAPAFDSRGRVIGTTYGGGHGHGVVYRYDPGSSQFSVLHDFCVVACTDGDQPQAGVVLDLNGNIYGTTVFGGANCADQIPHGCGVAWRLHGSKFAVLHSFCDKKNCADGGRPYGGVILDASGDLFGTTSFGGPYVSFMTAGTVFKLSP
jgi:uncharacterized repeat protein (TIGR03803 family)